MKFRQSLENGLRSTAAKSDLMMWKRRTTECFKKGIVALSSEVNVLITMREVVDRLDFGKVTQHGLLHRELHASCEYPSINVSQWSDVKEMKKSDVRQGTRCMSKSNKGDVQTLYRSVSRIECGSTRFVLCTMVWASRCRYEVKLC